MAPLLHKRAVAAAASQQAISRRPYHSQRQAAAPAPLLAMTVVAAAAAAAAAALALAPPTTACEEQQPPPQQTLPVEFLAGLRAIVGEDNVSEDPEERKEHSKPWSSYHTIPTVPDVVVRPCSTEEVSRVLRLCWTYRVPVVPYGGATSLEGHTLAPARGVSLDMNRMNRLLRLSSEDLDATVEAGLGYLDLNEKLAPKGICFPLDPGPGASIGGMCACRCSGSTAVKYGTMRDNVLGVTAVLADGTVIKTGTRARKSAAGYDLTRLLIGSEGTLGVITEVTLRLRRKPEHSAAVRVCFPTVRAAAAAANATLQAGVEVGRCELMDEDMVRIVNEANGFHDTEATTLLYELVGGSAAAVQDQVGRVQEVVAKHGGFSMEISEDEGHATAMWRARKEALWSAGAAYPDREVMITDVCVPLSKLAQMIGQTKDEIAASFLPSPLVAHAGDGNFHSFIMFHPEKPEEVEEAKRLSSRMVHAALALDGTCTGEHGVGLGKIKYLEEELGPGAIKTMATIKKALDPHNLLNPGKVLHQTIDPTTGRYHLCV